MVVVIGALVVRVVVALSAMWNVTIISCSGSNATVSDRAYHDFTTHRPRVVVIIGALVVNAVVDLSARVM